MTSSSAPCYTLVHDDAQESYTAQDMRAALERGTDELKLDTLRRIIVSTLNGNPQPTLLMPIIQFVLPSRNKQIKKMLHFYWEVCPKYDEAGKLKQEMILVWCVALLGQREHSDDESHRRAATRSGTTSSIPTSTSEAPRSGSCKSSRSRNFSSR